MVFCGVVSYLLWEITSTERDSNYRLWILINTQRVRATDSMLEWNHMDWDWATTFWQKATKPDFYLYCDHVLWSCINHYYVQFLSRVKTPLMLMSVCKGHWTKPQQITQHQHPISFIKQLNSGRFLLEFSVTWHARTDKFINQHGMIWCILGHATYVACTY